MIRLICPVSGKSDRGVLILEEKTVPGRIKLPHVLPGYAYK